MNDEVFVNLERALNLIEDAHDLLEKNSLADVIVGQLYDDTARTISKLNTLEREGKRDANQSR